MNSFYSILLAIFVAFSMSSCCAFRSVPSDMQIKDLVRFENGVDDVIKIGRNGVYVDDHFYPSSVCSNRRFRCIRFETFGAIIVPRRCNSWYRFHWNVDGIKVLLQGFVPGTARPTLFTSLNPHFGYIFDNGPDGGIRAILYDTSGRINITRDFQFTEQFRLDYLKTMRYQRVGDRPFMACVKAD